MDRRNRCKGTIVITIEPTEKLKELKIRVAAYARVSTSSEDQLNSFEAQVNYYTSLIASKENWILADYMPMKGLQELLLKRGKIFKGCWQTAAGG